MLAEWPLVAAALPTTLLLCGAGLGWWRSAGIEYVAFGINSVLSRGAGVRCRPRLTRGSCEPQADGTACQSALRGTLSRTR